MPVNEPAQISITATAKANRGRTAHAVNASSQPTAGDAAVISLSSMRRQTPSWNRGGNDGVDRAFRNSAPSAASELGFSGFM